ncbi:hypothetical protein BDV98DRAFT_587277 [Pterulicium gracile]|uniref:Uncharacterized protein n=1 Tax=Pterulicium gracile TaxID=1884261 RepID=A0A5C3PZA0_9AGAR|nr:hypothetical protein BDV98DRAFT_587277 [Pterula gracilis]
MCTFSYPYSVYLLLDLQVLVVVKASCLGVVTDGCLGSDVRRSLRRGQDEGLFHGHNKSGMGGMTLPQLQPALHNAPHSVPDSQHKKHQHGITPLNGSSGCGAPGNKNVWYWVHSGGSDQMERASKKASKSGGIESDHANIEEKAAQSNILSLDVGSLGSKNNS